MFSSSQRFVFVISLVLCVLWSTSAASVGSEHNMEEYRVKRQTVQQLTAELNALENFVQPVITALQSAKSAITTFVSATAAPTGLLSTLSGATSAFSTATKNILNLLPNLGSTITNVQSAVQGAIAKAGTLVGQTVQISSSPSIDSIIASLQADLSKIQSLLANPTSITAPIVNGLIQDINELENKAIGALSGAQSSLNTQVTNLISTINGIVSNLNDAVSQTGGLSVSASTGGIISNLQSITSSLGQAVSNVQSTASSIQMAAQTLASALITKEQAIVSNYATLLTNTAQQICS